MVHHTFSSPPPSALLLEGAPNFRDLGGYTNKHGQSLKTGLIFRSDHLGKLTASDFQKLQAHNHQPWLILDFRGIEERKTHVCALPEAKILSLSIEPTVVQILSDLLESGVNVSAEKTVELMQDTYRNFILEHADRFKAFFEALLTHPQHNVVFHCTAGKDRTGVAATLLLHALEVPMQTIWYDYLLTNERLKHLPIFESAPEVAKVLTTVQPAFLQAALDAISQHHSDLDTFLDKVLGLNESKRQQLANRVIA
jgi:protein-tyrosine phosphatase